MRRHAKASTAGSTKRRAKGLGRFFRGAFATRDASSDSKGTGAPATGRLVLPVGLFAALMALLVFAIPAGATKIHLFKETFGSAAQPSFGNPRGVAIDQSTGDVLVMDAEGTPSIKRYNPDGTAANFSALGTNVIDGQGSGDETPQNGLGFASPSESQIAVDNSGTVTDGDVYVTQSSPKAVNVFASSGAYLGQLTESSGGAFNEACGVAVDPSGAVYVGDYGGGIHKFVPSANPPVNTDNTANFSTTSTPCTLAAGAGATAGFLFPAQYNGAISKIDSATGELKYVVSAASNTTVSVNPSSGHVYGASGSAIKEFDASGAGSATSVSSTALSGGARGVAVRGSTGDIFVSRSGNSKLEVFSAALSALPEATTNAATGKTGTKATLNGIVNPEGVPITECKFEYGLTTSYGSSKPCEGAIPTDESPHPVTAALTGLSPNGITYHFRIVATFAGGTSNGTDQSFLTPDTVITGTAGAITSTTATLNGTVNPDGLAMTACEFEFGLTASYGQTAPCVPSAAGIGTGTSAVAVHADIGNLETGGAYHFRLKAANANGTILGADQTMLVTGPQIVAAWAQSVVRTEAELKAEINPRGLPTTYHIDYGTDTSYGQQTPESGVGFDGSVHTVAVPLEKLAPGTTYHYRVVASNSAVVNEGFDQMFTTFGPVVADTACPNQEFRVGPSAALPDCRAYEMVSAVDKNGRDARQVNRIGTDRNGYFEQTAPDGRRVTYSSSAAFGDQVGATNTNQYIAARGEDGWFTHGINPPIDAGPKLEPFGNNSFDFDSPFLAFSEDLSKAWVLNASRTPLTADAAQGFGNLFLRDNTSDSFVALTVGTPESPGGPNLGVDFGGASTDLSHQVFSAEGAWTPGASGSEQVYDFSGGQLHLVSVLPDGTASHEQASTGSYPPFGGDENSRYSNIQGAVSADGSRIFWSTGAAGGHRVYVRENPAQPQSALNGSGECTEPGKACTVDVTRIMPAATVESTFWAASSDGSSALFSFDPDDTGSDDGPAIDDLDMFDVDTEATTPIAHEVIGVAGASDDLSYIYFVSKESLDVGASAGHPNLYLDHEGAITLVATLSDTDVGTNNASAVSAVNSTPYRRNTRITPDGRHLAFMSSSRALSEATAGYDNTDANNGENDMEVYLYEVGGELVCVSCNPSGSRPAGQAVPYPYYPRRPDAALEGRSNVWASAWIPSWGHSSYASRLLSDDGNRLFFNSYDPLVPRDSNGEGDVYEWEAQGSGTCVKAGGCINLISTGESDKESEFFDASADGSDVFFYTESSIDPRDPGLFDVYDAHEKGGFPPPQSEPPCFGDACQGAPEPPHDQTPASASFHGVGDPVASKQRRNCRARSRHAKQGGRAKGKKASRRCTHNNRRAGR